jgi:putative nucleotidyltransferase with HDIG domain
MGLPFSVLIGFPCTGTIGQNRVVPKGQGRMFDRTPQRRQGVGRAARALSLSSIVGDTRLAPMSMQAIKEAERTRESHELRERPMGAAVRRAELLGGCAFLGCATALAVLGEPGRFSALTAAVFVIAMAVASNVRFDVGAGFTVPTQAVFVPMLFAVPVSTVPLLTVLALALGMTPKVLRGGLSPSWLLTAAGNSWFALGPSLVLLGAGDHSPDGRVGVLLLALAAQFCFDFAAAAARDWSFGDLSLGDLYREVAPIYAIDIALSCLGLVVAFALPGRAEWPVVLIAPLFLVLRVFSKERHERLQQMAELSDAYQGTALLLGDVVEADDTYTGEHSKSVVRLALDVADAMGLDDDRKRGVEFGALLHDVGKIAVPKEIINKPGKLNAREWEMMKTHTIEGQKMLEKIGGFMVEVGRIVRASHEGWDGRGYPDGLAGDSIPLEARVVSACDAFNAMTTTRSYRKAMPLLDAIDEMQKCAGSQFDPNVVDALVRVVRSARPPSELDPSASVTNDATKGASPGAEVVQAAWAMAGPHANTVTALADLAVRGGANVQRGQYVEVSGEIGHLEVIRAIADAAYKQGATFVDVQISDPVVQWTRIAAADEDSLGHVPRWEADRVRELAERGGASILVTGPTWPGLFDELDARRVAMASAGPSAQWRDASQLINWTIIPAATEGWASRLRPKLARDEALSALWADLAHVCRLDGPDPVAEWRRRLADLRDRAAQLTALELTAIRFEGPDTDLTVGLMPGVRWDRAELTSVSGVAFAPNLPTEEVYTTPDPLRVDGQVRLTRPVVIGGIEIADVLLRFDQGRIREVSGPPEASALREFVARDEGAARLGELALVDADSRVAGLGQTFGEILLDENAASHVALGYGFPALLPSASRQAANCSDHHLDVMIGAANVDVTGLARGGRSYPLLRDGRWAAAPSGRAVPPPGAKRQVAARSLRSYGGATTGGRS